MGFKTTALSVYYSFNSPLQVNKPALIDQMFIFISLSSLLATHVSLGCPHISP